MRVLLTLFPTTVTRMNLLALLGYSALNFSTNALIFMDTQANSNNYGISRNIAVQKIAGREGNVLQDMGGDSAIMTITGKWIYENVPNDALAPLSEFFNGLGLKIGWNWARVSMMKQIARLGMPLLLASNLSVGPVLLKKFTVAENGGMPNVFNYSLSFIELNPALSFGSNVVFSAIGGIENVVKGIANNIVGTSFQPTAIGEPRGY